MSDTDFTLAEFRRDQQRERRREYRMERRRIDLLMQAYVAGDVDYFFRNMTSDLFPWPRAFKVFAKLTNVPPKMQEAFRSAWRETKGPALQATSYAIFVAAMRVMMPSYTGPAVRLFRGTSWQEHECREYGSSWTLSASVAADFARRFQESECFGGGVVLETLAPPAAIISKMEYPKPFAAAEKRKYRRQYPGITFDEYHTEREFIVDGRILTDVKVKRRFACTSIRA